MTAKMTDKALHPPRTRECARITTSFTLNLPTQLPCAVGDDGTCCFTHGSAKTDQGLQAKGTATPQEATPPTSDDQSPTVNNQPDGVKPLKHDSCGNKDK